MPGRNTFVVHSGKRCPGGSGKRNIMAKDLIYGKNIAIIGAGPAGLTLARLLQLRGGKVAVYEREDAAIWEARGGSLELQQTAGMPAMKATGLLDQLELIHRPERTRLKMYDKYKTLILEIPPATAAGYEPEAERKDLYRVLSDALEPDTIHWGYDFKTLTVKDNRYELQFEHKEKVTADIVIGADGARSRLRPFLTPVKAGYTGTTLIHGMVEQPAMQCPELYGMVNKGTLFAVGNRKSIIVQEKANGNLEFYCSARQPEDWITTADIDFRSKPAVIRYLEDFYAGWNPVFYQLFAAAKRLVPRPVYATPVTQSWETQPNITLIGDAAHVIPSFASAGINMAMQDALVLAERLCDGTHKSIGAAISAYEQEMLARTARVQIQVRDSEHIFHTHTSMEHLF